MKLKKLNKALVAAGLVAGATISMPSQAVVMSNDGTGEVLIYPFYTVQGPDGAPRTTLVTINNTTDKFKAVKVRFHEAHNSRDALDFNLYLSPNDVWTGAISRNANGVAQLTTSDKSCTVPGQIMTQANAFSTLAYTQSVNNDGGNQNALRTNEGYIEVIEMGEIVKGTTILTSGKAPLSSASTLKTIGAAILHKSGLPGGKMGSNGMPIGCEALQAAAGTGGTWAAPTNSGSLDNTHVGVTQPTGGLTGSAMIVQAALGTVQAYNPTALKHFYDVQNATNAACVAALPAGASTTLHDTAGLYCETSTAGAVGVAAATTNRAFDDLHSFKDLDSTTANSRSVQTYPNLAMAYPQVSTIFNPDAAGTVTVGSATTLEWSANEAVSSGVTASKANVLFAAVKDLQVNLLNAVPAKVSDNTIANNCGGTNGNGVASTSAIGKVCANARPVSAVLAKNALINEYVLTQDAATGVDFRTDIVVTFPTKWYFSDNGLYSSAGNVTDGNNNKVTALETLSLPPFKSQFVSSGSNRDQACERFSIDSNDKLTGGVVSGQLFDQEEGKPNVTSTGLVPSPAINVTSPKNFICHESNVLTLNDGDLLSSRIANGLNASVANSASGKNSFNINFPTGFNAGWFTMAFDTGVGGSHKMTSVATGPMQVNSAAVNLNVPAAAATVTGLPAVGFVVEGLVSGASNFSGNFTIALPHKSK